MRTCIFCGRRADSKEHAWPAWLLGLIKGNKRSQIVAEMRDGLRSWSDASVTVRRVCKTDCNEGWMHRLEDRAKPILSRLIAGEYVEIGIEQQQLISLWSLKTAMVFDALDAATGYFAQEERDRLFRFQTGAPNYPFPPAIWFWLATYQGVNDITSFGALLQGVGILGNGPQIGDPASAFPVSGYTFTISAGRFVVQLLASRTPSERAGLQTYVHANSPRWGRFTRQIWPLATHLVTFPPQEVLDDVGASLNDFAQRWPSVPAKPPLQFS
jgi:hypothetical protein